MRLILIILIILIVFFGTVIIYDTHRFVVERFCFKSDKVKGKMRIVFLSDLHNKHFGTDNSKLIDAVEKENPDIVVIGGDMLTARLGESMDTALKLVRELADKYPVYYGIGNHEFRLFLYEDDYAGMKEKFLEGIKHENVKLLRNEMVEIPDKNVRIYGSEIEKRFYKRLEKTPMEPEYMDSILGEADEEYFNILLAHNPVYFEEYALWGADLTLAGHVHGGIMKLPIIGGVVSPMVTLFPKYDGGVFNEYGKTMLLSRGLGTHTIPIRVFNPGELNVIDINIEERQ